MQDEQPQDTLTRLQERRARLQKELDRIDVAIQVIKGEADLGEEAAGMPMSVSVEEDRPEQNDVALSNGSKTATTRKIEIRPDMYFGLSQHQAARKYLLDVGHADKLENMLKGIMAGGVEVGGVNPEETLRAMMTRNSSVFIRVGPRTFGLREFYPHLQGKPKKVYLRRRPAASKKGRVLRRMARKGRQSSPGGDGKEQASTAKEKAASEHV